MEPKMFKRMIIFFFATLMIGCTTSQEHPSVGLPLGEQITSIVNGDGVAFHVATAQVTQCVTEENPEGKVITYSLIPVEGAPDTGHLCMLGPDSNASESLGYGLSIGWENREAFLYIVPEGQEWDINPE